MSQNSFSKRHGYKGQPKEISIREEAPENLRSAHGLGLRPNERVAKLSREKIRYQRASIPPASAAFRCSTTGKLGRSIKDWEELMPISTYS